jgi:hypothetical protein
MRKDDIMHRQHSSGPENHRPRRRLYLSPHDGAEEQVFDCQTGDRILVNNSVEVVVLELHGDQVVLAVDDDFDALQPFNEEWSTSTVRRHHHH